MKFFLLLTGQRVTAITYESKTAIFVSNTQPRLIIEGHSKSESRIRDRLSYLESDSESDSDSVFEITQLCFLDFEYDYGRNRTKKNYEW